MKKQKSLIFIICSLFFFGYVIYFYYYFKISNDAQYKSPTNVLVPNIVHYIWFNKSTIDFITYLSILSVIKVQKPSVIHIHSNARNITGRYWHKLLDYSSKIDTVVQVSFFMQPTHVYGQKLSSVYHASDISRLHILRTYGGIYLDNDVLMLNDVNRLKVYDCVLGWPEKQYIGSQFILAKSSSTFLKMWQYGYKKYRSRDWYYNAGQYPTELLENNPDLCHTEPVYFGVQNLLDKLLSTEKWGDWKLYYGIHVLYRHSKFFRDLDETTVQNLTTNFGDIAKWILNLR